MRTVLFLAVLLLHGEQALCKPSRLAQLKRLLDPDGDVSGPIVKDSDLRRASASSSTPPPPPVAGGNSSIAALIDKALKHEFSDETATLTAEEATKPLNATAEIEEGTLETVIRISGKSRDAAEDVADAGGGGGGAGGRHNASRTGGAKSGHQQTGDDAQQLPSSLHTLTSADAVDRIIDNKNNVFILSRVGSDAVASLLVDPQLVQDITAVLATCAGFGILFEMIRQPVINGYLVAGAVLGPGGFGIIQELVQVESLSQVGVQLLLFNLGLELSMSKLRAVYGVAIFGGCIQILLSMLLTGSMAAFGGVSVSQGIFIGALLSMSSTSVVVKCLETTRSTNTLYGQITIGTLILQDCCVGLMFALLPVFRSETVAVNASLAAVQPAESRAAVVLMIFHVLFKLAAALALAAVVSKTVLVVVLRLLYRHGSSELVQLCLVAICLAASLVSHHYGISSELGAFIAGAMIAHAFIVSGLSGGVTPGGGSSLSGGGSSSGLLSSPQGGLGGGSLGVRGGDHHHHAHKEPHVLIESVHNVLTALFVASIGLMTSPT